MKKRALTLLPALVMCLSLCTSALVSTPHYLETDWSEALSSGVPLSTVVELITEKYLLPQTEGLNSVTANNGTAASDIVKLCRPVETQSVGGVACTKFQMDDFKDYYPECNQLRSISQLGNKFYVEYISRDGQELAFSYDANGLSDCCIYDPATDRALFFSRYEQIVYENFRNGEAVSSISNNTPQTADVQITSVGTKSNFSSDAEMLSEPPLGGSFCAYFANTPSAADRSSGPAYRTFHTVWPSSSRSCWYSSVPSSVGQRQR